MRRERKNRVASIGLKIYLAGNEKLKSTAMSECPTYLEPITKNKRAKMLAARNNGTFAEEIMHSHAQISTSVS
jgi:hypothetical protein